MSRDTTRPLAGLDSALDHLLTVTFSSTAPFASATPAELMTALGRLQQLANLVSTAEQQLLAHAIATDAFEDFGAASTADLLVGHLHVDRSEAHARVRRAKRTTPRTTLTGEALPPKLELLADAQAVGAVSGAHVDVVTHWLTKIEPHASLQQFADAETTVVALASEARPEAVAARGREILQDLDPDGPAPRRGETAGAELPAVR